MREMDGRNEPLLTAQKQQTPSQQRSQVLAGAGTSQCIAATPPTLALLKFSGRLNEMSYVSWIFSFICPTLKTQERSVHKEVELFFI